MQRIIGAVYGHGAWQVPDEGIHITPPNGTGDDDHDLWDELTWEASDCRATSSPATLRVARPPVPIAGQGSFFPGPCQEEGASRHQHVVLSPRVGGMQNASQVAEVQQIVDT